MKSLVERNIYTPNSFNVFQILLKNLSLYSQLAGLPKICRKT